MRGSPDELLEGERVGDELRKARRGLRIARVILFVQVAAELVVSTAVLLEIASQLERGRAVPGAVWAVVIVSLVVAVSTAVGAAFLFTRGWARVLSVVVQCVRFGFAMINMIVGYWQGVIALVLTGVTIRQILVHGPEVEVEVEEHRDSA